MKSYEDRVMHFIFSFAEYIGIVDQEPHPNGHGWVRILKPCATAILQVEGKPPGRRVIEVGGIEKVYDDWLDIYLPVTEVVEIRPIRKSGKLYNLYTEALIGINIDKIVLPNSDTLSGLDFRKNTKE